MSERVTERSHRPKVGARIRQSLGRAVLPVAAILAMPTAAIAAKPPKPLPDGVVGRITMANIRRHHSLTSCAGEAAVPVNVSPGGVKYDPQTSGGESSANSLPASQVIVSPFIISRTHPNAVVSGRAGFESGGYDVVGLEMSNPLTARAYPVADTTMFDINTAACVPTVFRDYETGGINPNDAVNKSFEGGFGTPDLGSVAAMSLVQPPPEA